MPKARMSPKHYLYWLGGALLFLSTTLRILAYPVITSDYTYFLSKWFDTLQSHVGLSAFTTTFADYAPLYLYLLKLLTFIPVSSLYSIKTLSVLFDLLIAALASVLIQRTAARRYSKSEGFLIFAVFFSIPTFILNSSLWAQSDAIYAACVLLSLYFILTNKALPAVTAFSVAISFKVQAIFFLPVLVGYCLRKEKTAGYLVLIPILFFLSIIPARLAGGSLADLLLVYAKESGEYSSLSVSAQSVFALLGNYQFTPFAEKYLFWVGLVVAGVCAVIITAVMYRRKNLSAKGVVFISLACVLLLPYFLPRMHERYFYLADLFSVLYAFYDPRRWYMPVLVVSSSFIAYMGFLSQVSWFANLNIGLIIPSIIDLVAIILLITAAFFHEEFIQAAHSDQV